MLKYIFTLITIGFISCSQQKYQPAEDALDAAREFKDACLKGEFDKAKFYLLANKESENVLDKIKSSYDKKTKQQQKESKEASIIILMNKEVSKKLSQIVLSNSVEKNADTIYVSLQNNLWLVDFESHKTLL